MRVVCCALLIMAACFLSSGCNLGENLDGAGEYAQQVANDEVIITELSDENNVVYFMPSTKKKISVGLIFKDDGYSIEVIKRSKLDEKIVSDEIYEFCETSDGWEWKLKSSNSWKTLYQKDSAKLIFEYTKKFPNL